MQRITTSVKRVRDAGYWCDDADDETGRLMRELGCGETAEIEISKVLDTIGLGAALMFLGAPHPRYKVQADEVLDKYIKNLLRRIEREAYVNLSVEQLVIFSSERDSLRAHRRAYWRQQKLTASMEYDYYCQAILILMSLHPFHIRAVHAGRAYLSAVYSPHNVRLRELETYLRQQL